MNQGQLLFLPILVLACGSLLSGCGGGSTSTTDNLEQTSESSQEQTQQASVGEVIMHDQPESVTNDAFARFEFSASQANGYQCKQGDEPYDSCSSPFYVYPLTAGEHRVSVRAVGSDGTEGEPTTVTWSVSSIFTRDDEAGLHADVTETVVQPDAVAQNSWRGIFRINCDFAHATYDDPIVFPGQDDAAHLHRFYGNTLVDENSDTTSLFTTGESTCQGNELNRSSYWVPTLLAPAYDEVTGDRLQDETGEPAWEVVPAVVGDNEEAHEIFYYSAGVDDLGSIEPIPLGLKMIAGDHSAMPGQEQDTSIVRWHCQSWESDEATNPQWSTSIPECVAPDRLRMDVFFPSCWNGVDLDSDDHKSHLAYPVSSGGSDGIVCPESHPQPIIRVSFHYAFGVKPDVYHPETRSSRGWRLASDMYQVSSQTPGGMSLHADWFNAWHPEALETVLEHCIKGGLDCHDGNLANGYRLSGTREGTQTEAGIINKGLGYDSD